MSSTHLGNLLVQRAERQQAAVMKLLRRGAEMLFKNTTGEVAELTDSVFKSTCSLLVTLSRYCAKRNKISGADAKLVLLSMRWAAVGLMVGLGHRFSDRFMNMVITQDVVRLTKKSLVMFSGVVRSVSFNVGSISLPIIHDASLAPVVFQFLCEMRTNDVMCRLLRRAMSEKEKSEVLELIGIVRALEAFSERAHDGKINVDDNVLAFSVDYKIKCGSARKKTAVAS